MTALIYGIVFILLITILITIGNLVFSISEMNENKENKTNILKVIKLSVFVLIKIVLFVLIINLIMFSFFGNEVDLNNLQTQLLTIFISFQIITESISINKLMRVTVKHLNENKMPIIEHINNIKSINLFGNIIKVNKIFWIVSSVLNLVTILYLIILMIFDFSLFYQNMFIYFMALIYIKYLTITTFDSNKLSITN